MTQYECKILTPDFKQRVDQFIDSMAETFKTRLSPRRLDEYKLNTRNRIYKIWGGDPDQKILKIVLTGKGLLKPEFTLRTFTAETSIFRKYPRILWEGKLTPIHLIDDIFAYKQLEFA